MRHRNLFQRLDTYVIIVLFAAYFIGLFLYSRTIIENKDIVSLIISAVVPFFLSIFVSLYLANQTSKENLTLNEETRKMVQKLPEVLNNKKIVCHGTKHNVPDKEIFWSNLLNYAESKFILVGRSNKSWIAKSDDQSRSLGQAIIRIVESEGDVKILSDNNQANIDKTIAFFKHFVYPHLDGKNKKEAKALLEKVKKHTVYAVVENSFVNYAAVISDNRILIIPTLNSQEFRNEGMVIELIREYNRLEFDSYTSDVDRVFKAKQNLLNELNTEYETKINARPR